MDNPRYERANIVMNSKDEEQTIEEKPEVQNSLTSIFAEAIAEVVTNCLGELRANNKNDEPKDWITIKGNHIKIEKDETPKQATKKFEIRTAIQKIKDGEETEITIKDIREDLAQYGGTNDITFLKGNEKGGIKHINTDHKDDFDGVINTIVKGKITSVVPERKVYIETKDYLALLSLDYFGKKKTWLLTGYKKDEDNKNRLSPIF